MFEEEGAKRVGEKDADSCEDKHYASHMQLIIAGNPWKGGFTNT